MLKKTAKKAAKITLALIAVSTAVLCIVQMFFTLSAKSLYSSVITMGTVIPPKGSTRSYKDTSNSKKLPARYGNIKLPISRELPFAFTFSRNEDTPESDGQAPKDDLTDIPPDKEDNIDEELPIIDKHPVLSIDMSENQTENNLTYKNESKYSPDINALANDEYPLKYSKPAVTGTQDEPVVLIVHTHGTECYLPDGYTEYTDETPTRSTDVELNVVGVGKVFADTLNENGISTLHCEIMFDKDSYSQSYELSEKTVIEYLEAYPSIQYVFDIHRDSIIRNNKEKIKPVTIIDDVSTAQAMFVVGTNSSGADHPNWMDNLTVACIFQKALISDHGKIMRPINIRAASFNAEHTTGSILIEIGTCGNTVSEAKNCAALLASTIARVILNDGIK